METKLTKKQTIQFTKQFKENRYTHTITCTVRYDDRCGNGHNSFSITGVVVRGMYEDANKAPDSRWQQCGCIHEDIEKHFPELKKYIKWHFMNSNGPTHYIANTLYHISDRDCWGKREGEPYSYKPSIIFGDNPINHKPSQKLVDWLSEQETFENLATESIEHDKDSETFNKKYSFFGFCKEWHKCPFNSINEAENFLHALQNCDPLFVQIATQIGKGKKPELKAARSTAIWPNATLEQLQDKNALQKRLPALIKRFQKDLKELNLVY